MVRQQAGDGLEDFLWRIIGARDQCAGAGDFVSAHGWSDIIALKRRCRDFLERFGSANPQ